MKKRIFQVLIIILFTFILLIVADNQLNFEIDRTTEEVTAFVPPSNTAYFVIDTPKGESIISGLSDISEILNKLNFAAYSYEFEGEFNYDMILSCVNINKLSEANLLIKDNYMVNGNRIFELDFNIEQYLSNISRNY